MKFNKPSIIARRVLAIGLLSATIPNLINDFVHIPDFFRGAMVGVGFGLEIIGIILMRRNNKACRNSSADVTILNN